jgi:hypothetical protein
VVLPPARDDNFPSSSRRLLKWSAAFGGIGGTIGGAVGLLVDIGDIGTAVELEILIGTVVGGCVGISLSKRFEDSSALLEKGEAFDFLYAARNQNPRVANPRLVEEALKRIPSFDKNDDGRRWYAKDDLERFLRAPSRVRRRPDAMGLRAKRRARPHRPLIALG